MSRALVATLVVLTLVLAACGGAADDGRAAADDDPGVPTGAGRLYVQKAESASIVTDGAASVLVLGGVDPSTTWFADRPARQAGSLETTAFVDGWEAAGFAVTPPNAVVQLESGGRTSSAVVLTDPRWDPDAAELRYTVRPDEGATLPPNRTGPVALFIDDGGGGPAATTMTLTVENLPAISPAVRFDFRGLTLDLSDVTVSSPRVGSIALERLTLSDSSISFQPGGGGDGAVSEVAIELTVVTPAGTQDFSVVSSLPFSSGATASLSFVGVEGGTELNDGPTEVALPD